MLDERLANLALCTLVKAKVRETLNPLLKQVAEFVSETVKDTGRDEITTLEELQMKAWMLQLVSEMADIIVGEQREKVKKSIRQLEEKKKAE